MLLHESFTLCPLSRRLGEVQLIFKYRMERYYRSYSYMVLHASVRKTLAPLNPWLSHTPAGSDLMGEEIISFAFLFFFWVFPFSKKYQGGKTTSSPLTLWGIVVFSTLLSKPRLVGRVD